METAVVFGMRVHGSGRESMRACSRGGAARRGAAGARRPFIALLDGMHTVSGCATEGMHVGQNIKAKTVFVCTATFCVMAKR